jgi:Mg2+ and Co2+ transporter CorA
LAGGPNTSKKQPNGHRQDGVLDLRDAIYNDVNGDNIFQLMRKTQCYDCLDFVASAVWHAVMLFLSTDIPDKPIPPGLKVFQIFRESLCALGERRTRAFSRFKKTQKQIAESLSEKSAARSMKLLTEALNELGNCDDLTCLINARDIHEELTILDGLFDKQAQIVQQMAKAYLDIDTSNKAKSDTPEGIYTHGRAIKWLGKADEKIGQYRDDVAKMKKTCKDICDSYQRLLSMKQKEAGIVEATCARISGDNTTRQQYAMMTFTVVTVLFLPLSFFTSLFGMNVKEWTGDRQKSLGAVMILSGAISAGIIVIALAAAFWTFYSWWLRKRIMNLLLGRSGQKQTRIGQGLDADSVRSSDLENQASGPTISGTAPEPLARWSRLFHHRTRSAAESHESAKLEDHD